jgi:hypothetical protein
VKKKKRKKKQTNSKFERKFFVKRETNYRQRGKKTFVDKMFGFSFSFSFFQSRKKMNETTLQEKFQRRFFISLNIP